MIYTSKPHEALSSAIKRLETIRETHPDLCLDEDLAHYRQALEGSLAERDGAPTASDIAAAMWDEPEPPTPNTRAIQEACAEIAEGLSVGPKFNGRDYRHAFRIAEAIRNADLSDIAPDPVAQIVAWLRSEDTKRPQDNWCAWIAKRIERGEYKGEG